MFRELLAASGEESAQKRGSSGFVGMRGRRSELDFDDHVSILRTTQYMYTHTRVFVLVHRSVFEKGLLQTKMSHKTLKNLIIFGR